MIPAKILAKILVPTDLQRAPLGHVHTIESKTAGTQISPKFLRESLK
jgi:hypothetical protein